ncbi:MAG TPA: aconitate hydratase AcnA [Gemmatimonadetes bacterium]|nr:aconitate hydratase AcnA [Gemmatimonadota bacterium]
MGNDPFGALSKLDLMEGSTSFYSLSTLEASGVADLDRLPFSIRILLENALRHSGGPYVEEDHVQAIAAWSPTNAGADVPFMPSRVVLQDFTGVPAVVDLAAMRDGLKALGGDPNRINPVVPADLVIDHSVQVDFFGTPEAYRQNVEREFERNRERYALLRWAQHAFEDFRVVPPGTGIVHQVNLEYLASVIHRRTENGMSVAYPDTLVGTDSHTTMINGLGVLGWGVGGIEAEAVLTGQPYYMLLPEVVGVKFTGELGEGATATDLVLHIVQMLRAHGVVGRFVEYFGPGLSNLTLPDRATLANMSPEYGATIGFFPVDDETLAYLSGSGRSAEVVERVERISKEQRLFRTDETPDPEFTEILHMDLGTVEPSLAGPKRPQDRIAMGDLPQAFSRDLPALAPSGFLVNGDGPRTVQVDLDGETCELGDGSIVIAAITSCTNTSNPSVMVGAGLLAKKAVELGLQVKPWVKSSMAPGSKVVTDYLEASGLMEYLDQLRFGVVGYGCTTCIGNSGPLAEPVSEAIRDQGLVVAAVLSGNRNFEARIHPEIRANYLASPILVVAYALAGRVDIDWETEPLGQGVDGPVYLRDIWPGSDVIRETVQQALVPEMYERRYAEVFEGNDLWQALPLPSDDDNLYDWEEDSTYIRNPPFFQSMSQGIGELEDIEGARVLGMFGQTTTTDHISPAGAIPKDEPAGVYLQERGVKPWQFNTFGSRRGNHEVMIRGTFGNVRIRNLMLDDREGGYTVHVPSGDELSIYDAAMRYESEGTPLIVLAGREYGTGSSRDWAAKGTLLLGVKAVIAESYERIHRSNLVGMGVLPLQFEEGDTPQSLGLTGRETFDILGISEALAPHARLTVVARTGDGHETSFSTVARLDSAVDVEYYRNGGILHTVLRRIASGEM